MMSRNKRIFSSLVFIIVTCLSLTADSPAGSQQGTAKPPVQGEQQGETPVTPGGNPDEANLTLVQMLQKIGLTQPQIRQIRQIKQRNQPVMNQLHRDVLDRRQALDEATYSDNFDEATVNAR